MLCFSYELERSKMQLINILILLLILQTISLGGFHDPKNPQSPEFDLTSKELESHLRFLASDELEGRYVGTQGNRLAARYIAEQFRLWGLRAAPEFKDFFQDVPLVLQTLPSIGVITTDRTELFHTTDFLLLSGEAQLDSSVVFAGHGLVDLELGIDDYEGLDVKDKLVVVKFGVPPLKSMSNKTQQTLHWSILKRSLASKRGAVGILEIIPPNLWKYFSQELTRPRIVFKQDFESNRDELFHALVLKFEENLPEWKTLRVNVPSVQGKAQFTSNVLGVIEGIDLELVDEYIIVTAHYDHLGKGLDLPEATPKDFIFNGARDNGMGVVALLAAAKSLATKKARRPILFIAVTGEEQGLLGSSFYVNNPAIPLSDSMFVLNTDGAGFTHTNIVTIFGLMRTSAQNLIESACLPFGLKIFPEPSQNKDLFYRSDNLPFARKGIPSLTFSPGFLVMDDSIMRHYHRPSDEVSDDFDFDYLLRFSQAFSNTVRALANTEKTPVWLDGEEFKKAWYRLYLNKN